MLALRDRVRDTFIVIILLKERGISMRSEKRKNRVFLAGIMVIMMIINLLSGVNASVSKAEEPGTIDPNIKTLTIEKKWLDGKDSRDEVTVTITSDAEDEIGPIDPIILEDGSWEKSVKLKVKTPSNKIIKYTVTEQANLPEYEVYDTVITLSPEGKTDKGESTSFDFGDDPVDKKITFESTWMNVETVKIKKVWKGQPAKEARFQLIATEGSPDQEVPGVPVEEKAAEVEVIETIKLDSSNFVPSATEGETVWEKEYKINQPQIKKIDGSEGKIVSLSYDFREIDENGKAVVYNLDGENEGSSYSVKFGLLKLDGKTYKATRLENNSCPSECGDKFVYGFVNEYAEKTSIQAYKTWIGDKAKAKFGVVNKAEPDKVIASIDKGEDEEDAYWVKFDNLNIVDAAGNIIDYEIKELDQNGKVLNDGDILTVDGKRFIVKYYPNGYITNAIPIDITVTKTWNGKVPTTELESVEVAVVDSTYYPPYNNKPIIAKVTLNKENNWTHDFKDIPKPDGGYKVVELKVNGFTVDDSYETLYTGETTYDPESCSIKSSTKVTIDNKYAPKRDCGSNVFKIWDDSAKKQKIAVNRYKKVDGKWKFDKVGAAPGENSIEEIKFAGDQDCIIIPPPACPPVMPPSPAPCDDCVTVKPGVPSPACPPTMGPSPASLPSLKEVVLAKADDSLAMVSKAIAMNRPAVLDEGLVAFTDSEEFLDVEVTIGNAQLSQEELNRILSLTDLKEFEYKLGEYNVKITKLADGRTIIKNSGIVTPNPDPSPNPEPNPGPVPPTPVIPVSPTPVVPVTPVPPVTPGITPTPTPDPVNPSLDVPNDPIPEGNNDEDGIEEIDDDDTPEGGNEEDTDIPNDETPRGSKKLPKTGGSTGGFAVMIGIGLLGLGLVYRKRR